MIKQVKRENKKQDGKLRVDNEEENKRSNLLVRE